MFRLTHAASILAIVLLAGCFEWSSSPSSAKSDKGIIGKTTQDIQQFDANKQNQVVSDQKIHATDPITAPLSAYGPMTESIAKTKIKAALNYFYGENERYPKD